MVVTGAVNREIDVIFTNSDGEPRKARLPAHRLGPGATERIIDPGEDIVKARLSRLDYRRP